ncbi:uncharacterized protein B0H18DRAFT_1218635 [Fomitopsis serialis]|uniref:uncharacterized protein n=1 Tax=Fomitopsis serialis TaxID=139415 RepID=UPI002007939A|nr:uncharacterized protein B0H18DRAFT_1218635 [Neoantrodia serialis]KAH9910904.1 hypothetical protein B0H18DRAFT_1218635 [Neoantrodia serialis]
MSDVGLGVGEQEGKWVRGQGGIERRPAPHTRGPRARWANAQHADTADERAGRQAQAGEQAHKRAGGERVPAGGRAHKLATTRTATASVRGECRTDRTPENATHTTTASTQGECPACKRSRRVHALRAHAAGGRTAGMGARAGE